MVRRTKNPVIVADVLGVLLSSAVAIDGLAVAALARRLKPRVYAALARLEDCGWVESEWEPVPAGGAARRRLYQLTPGGAVAAARIVEEARAMPARRALARPRPVVVLRRLPALLRGTR